MALNFDISFENTLRQLADTQARLMEVGQLLDKQERSAGRMGSALAKGLSATETYFKRVDASLQKTHGDTLEISKALDVARREANKTFQSLVKGNVNATVKLEALNGRLGELGRLVQDTASKNAYNKWLEKGAALSGEAAGQAEFYRQRLSQLSTQEGVSAVEAAKLVKERTKAIQAMASAASQSANYRQIISQLIEAEREMAVTGQKVAWGYERLTSASAALTAQQRAAKEAIDQANKSLIEGASNLERYTGANGKAEQAAARLANQEKSSAAARKREMDELRRDIQERARLREQEEAGYARQANAGAITQHERERARVLAQLRTAIEERYAAESGGIKIAEKLTRQEAEYQARMERVNAVIQRRNNLRRAEASASITLSSSEAKLTQRIREQTAEYQRRATYMQMTTAQLFGLSRGTDKLSRDMHINAQAAAMFRAALGGLNASIGIYTSATVLAASVTYAMASAVRTGVSAGMEFTETMARAEAVMMTSSDAATAAGRSMEAVTLQVRALGASTLFTSTEVAGGLVDLGMAGLSASQAMTALAPSLNLAAIGSIEMSRAADIATNVMTSFDKNATQLGNVVDIMATAITNSNTNIDQLANALSYVGPAAQAAGFNLKDTTAAIELLSNAGIKASRAGTGLRRFMLNIQNPTAKGAAVMERYGISIVDAEGQTRSMMDILGQFNRALHTDAITPAERTAAIMDLVGVRAQSAVARMISSFDQFGVLRRQLDEVEGAAAKMRETMEDVLSMDWRQLKSAFQDIQLDVFTTYEETLRSFTAQARLSLMELQEVNEEMTNMVFSPEQIAEGSVVTELDILIARMGEAIDVAKGLGIAFGTWKAASVATTMTSALSRNLWTFGERMEVATQKLRKNQTAQSATNAAIGAGTVGLKAHTGAQGLFTSAISKGTMELGLHAQALSMVGRAASVAMAAMGWAGVVYGVYTAVKTLFSNDTAGRIAAHNERVESAKLKYEELQQAISKTTEARQLAALNARAKEADEEAEGLRYRIELANESLAQFDEQSAAYQRITDDIYRYTQALHDNENQAAEAREAASKIGVNEAQVEGMRERLAMLTENIALTARSIEDYRNQAERLGEQAEVTRAADGGVELARAQQAAAEKSEILANYLEYLTWTYDALTDSTNKAEKAASNHGEALAASLNSQTAQIEADYRFENLSDFEKMKQMEAERNVILASSIRLGQEGMALNEEGVDVMQRWSERALEANEAHLEFSHSVRETWLEVAEAQKELEKAQRNEIDTLESLEQQMKNVQAARIAMYAVSAVTGEGADPDKMLELIQLQTDLQERQNRLNERNTRRTGVGSRGGKSEAEREVEQAVAAFERLRAQYDPLGTASREFNDTQKQLKSLLAANKITTDDYSLAIKHLAENLQKSVEEHSDYYKELKRLREEYLQDSNLSTLFEDRSKVSMLPEGERQIAERAINSRIKEETFSGLPDSGGLDASVSGPVGEWARLQTETHQMQQAYDDRIGAFQDYAQQDLENREQWVEQIAKLEQKKNLNSEVMQRQSQIAMVAMGEQVLGEMAGMFQKGSALQKIMFAAQKAASITQIIMHGEVAAMQALATIPPPANVGVANTMRAMAGFSAGIVGAQAIGSIATGQTGGTDYAGAYDNGGYVPGGKWAIVGEVGPEIVAGPARVTSRRETAEMLGRGGGQNVYSPTIKVNVHVDMSDGNNSNVQVELKEQFGAMAQVIEGKVIQIIRRELRPRGLLDRRS